MKFRKVPCRRGRVDIDSRVLYYSGRHGFSRNVVVADESVAEGARRESSYESDDLIKDLFSWRDSSTGQRYLLCLGVGSSPINSGKVSE